MADSWSIICNNRFINRFDKVSFKPSSKYILTETFCQEPRENYFGRQGPMSQRGDLRTLRTFGYQDNTIHNSKVFRPIAGNSRKDQEWNFKVNAEPLFSRTKKKNQKSYTYFWSVLFIFLLLSSYVYGFKRLVKRRLFK